MLGRAGGRLPSCRNGVKPGDAIRGFEMDAPLNPGDYEMSISIATKSLDTEQTMNGGNVKTTLHVTE